MKAVVAAFNQERALVGAFSVITNLRMQFFKALVKAWLPEQNVQSLESTVKTLHEALDFDGAKINQLHLALYRFQVRFFNMQHVKSKNLGSVA